MAHEDPDLLEPDLALLACEAAIELDNLVFGRATKLGAVRMLARVIAGSGEDGVTAYSLLYDPESDPTDAIAMHLAIRGLEIAEPTTVAQLVQEVNKIASVLNSILSAPDEARQTRQEKVKKMRDFCVALSRRAAARESPSREFLAAEG